MNYQKIKKGDKFLIDTEGTFPIKMEIIEIVEKKERNFWGKIKNYKIYFLEGKIEEGFKITTYQARYSEKVLINNIIRKI